MSEAARPRYVHGVNFGKDLCDALGIDATDVAHVTIEVPANGVVEVTATYLLCVDDADEGVAIMKRYRLVEVDEEADE